VRWGQRHVPLHRRAPRNSRPPRHRAGLAVRARAEIAGAFDRQNLGKPAAGAVDPALDGADRAATDLGGLLVGEARRADQDQRFLDVDRPTLQQLVEESGRELAVQIATDILIIEDEALIAMDLENLLENLGHEVTGIARTRTDAVTLAKAKRPGLILADIQLADGSSGMDAVNELLTTFEVPVIFITAYPERFLTGKRPEPAFLVP
jgi:hypothetical protein